MFTPAQVSEMLNLAPSSLRRYVTIFPDLLSDTAKLPSKSRRYTDADILVLRRIKDLIRSRKTPEEIRVALQVVEPEEPASSALALMPEVIQQFENLRAQLAEMQANQETTKQELEETRARLKALEERLSEPWYRRIFKRRPPE